MSAASILLSHLTLSASDGRLLFSDINLRFARERTGLVGRNGVGKTTLLELIADGRAPRQSGAIQVNGKLGVFRQSVQIKPGETIVDLLGVREPLAMLSRAERGEATTEELALADWTLEERLASALVQTGLDAPPDTPLAALSGGQRTRAGLAALVFANPDFLLLDEPTNNLDRDGRAALYDLLVGWRAGAIVISHDRELLEIMDSIVELTSLGAARYGGNWSAYREWKAVELSAAQRDFTEAEKHVSSDQTVDGIASISVPPGAGLLVFTDGADWFTNGQNFQRTLIEPQGYLSVLSVSASPLSPMPTSDQSAKTAIYYRPDKGNLVPISNGTVLTVRDFSELTLTLNSNHVASGIYDVFLFDDSGTITIGTGPVWNTVTEGSGARGTGAGTT